MLSKVHYQGSLLRPWPQKMAVFRGQGWHLDPHSPVLIKISADKRPLNQLTVKKIFFSLIIKTFCHNHHHIVHEKTITLSVWMKEICTLLVKLHIICSRMQRVNQHAIDPLSYRWGVPPVVIRCVHRTMQMWVPQTWITAQGIAIVMTRTRTQDLSGFVYSPQPWFQPIRISDTYLYRAKCNQC